MLTNQRRESGGGHLSVKHYTSSSSSSPVVTGTQLPVTPIDNKQEKSSVNIIARMSFLFEMWNVFVWFYLLTFSILLKAGLTVTVNILTAPVTEI